MSNINIFYNIMILVNFYLHITVLFGRTVFEYKYIIIDNNILYYHLYFIKFINFYNRFLYKSKIIILIIGENIIHHNNFITMIGIRCTV